MVQIQHITISNWNKQNSQRSNSHNESPTKTNNNQWTDYNHRHSLLTMAQWSHGTVGNETQDSQQSNKCRDSKQWDNCSVGAEIQTTLSLTMMSTTSTDLPVDTVHNENTVTKKSYQTRMFSVVFWTQSMTLAGRLFHIHAAASPSHIRQYVYTHRHWKIQGGQIQPWPSSWF